MKNLITLPAQQAKVSRISSWLKSENQLFTALMERKVTNRQMLLYCHAMMLTATEYAKKIAYSLCGSKENNHLCSAKLKHVCHVRRATVKRSYKNGLFLCLFVLLRSKIFRLSSQNFIALRSDYCLSFATGDDSRFSVLMRNSNSMKNQTVVAPKATVGMKDAVRTWLSSDNKLFTFLMERRVTNRQMLLYCHAMMLTAAEYAKKIACSLCGSKENNHLCNVLLLIRAGRLANNFAAGIFYAFGQTYSSVPCGALMRPLPESGGEQRGAELFLYPSSNNQHIVSF